MLTRLLCLIRPRKRTQSKSVHTVKDVINEPSIPFIPTNMAKRTLADSNSLDFGRYEYPVYQARACNSVVESEMVQQWCHLCIHGTTVLAHRAHAPGCMISLEMILPVVLASVGHKWRFAVCVKADVRS